MSSPRPRPAKKPPASKHGGAFTAHEPQLNKKAAAIERCGFFA
jgi:hypothetical protein